MKPATQDLPDCRILHVDDSEDEAFLFQHALEKLSYIGSYEWVSSGEAASTRLKEGVAPTVIVTDGFRAIGPHVLDGLCATQKDVPIIVYSGDADPQSIKHANEHQVLAYLLKKNTFEESLVAVARILELSRKSSRKPTAP